MIRDSTCDTVDLLDDGDPIGIDDLAAAAGLTRRAVRFYVQQKLLPPPAGVGRGRHYGRSHLDRLREIVAQQAAGHSLDAIRRLAAGQPVPPPPPPPAARRPKPSLSAQLWTRVTLADGVELSFDTAKHQPDAADLLALRDLARRVFARTDD